MPCNSAPSPQFSREDMDAVEIYFQAEIDKVTRVACEAIKLIKRNALYDSLSVSAKAWSHEHDAWDAARTLIEDSVKVTIRRDTFDEDGKWIDWGDGRRPVSDDDISALRATENPEVIDSGADQALAHTVYDDLLDDVEKGDDIIESALTDDAFVRNIEAQVKNETEEPQAGRSVEVG